MLYDGGGGGSGDNRSNNIDQHFSSLSKILKSRDVQALLAFLREPLSQIRDVRNVTLDLGPFVRNNI